MKVVTIVGTRPQFVKASPLSAALRPAHREVLVHTGQHYDREMSDVFFDELGIPAPDFNLGIGSGPHGAQTGAMLAELERVLRAESPDVALVFGDTNSTLAGALAAAKLHVPVAHVEAGLRSFNRRMPEETNRVLTDHISDWLFAPTEAARANLAREGIARGVHVVGDIMVDALRLHRRRLPGRPDPLSRLDLRPGAYYLATVHRAENTDDRARLGAIVTALGMLDQSVVWPLHPRTRPLLAQYGLELPPGVRPIEPLGYLDMIRLQDGAAAIVTDSGGVQKEAYLLGVPCVTLREETEWVETVAAGWNTLAGADPARILAAVAATRQPPSAHPDLYGDGHTAERIVEILASARGTSR